MIWDYLIFMCCGLCLFSFIVLSLSVLYLYFTVLKNRPALKKKLENVKRGKNLSKDSPKATDAEFREVE